MAGSGSEKRRRPVTKKARFDEKEAALIDEQADRLGVSVAALIRYAILGVDLPRASRRPSVNTEAVSHLLGTIGPLKHALLKAAAKGTPGENDRAVEAACRDIAEMRNELFEALGREP